MMRTNAICTVLLLLGASLAPGGAFGAGEPRQDAVARADPGVTNQGAHSVEASWSLSEGAGYETQNVVLDPGKANLSQVTTSGGDLWKQQTGLGNGNEREDFSAAYDDVNNQMIIHGGYYYILGMQDASWSQPLYTYDPAADSWTARGTAKLPAGNVAAWDRADQAFVTHGGYYTYFDQNQGRTLYVVYNSTFAWYPSSSSWTQLSDGPRLYHHSAVWDPDDGVMLVFGGMDTRLVQNQSVNTYFGNLWAYNLTLDNWTQLNASGGPPMSRAYHTAVWDNESGQMIVFGGYDGTQHFSDVWAYNYTQNRWTQKTSAPSGRSLHAACWNSAQNLMTVYGGTPGVGNSNDTLSYDPSADQWSSNTKMPAPGRLQPAAVYDPVRQEMLVYGGGTGSGRDEYSQTWSFKYGDKVLRYVAEGSIQSPVFDIGEGFYAVDGISWYGDMPLGANLILRFRASPTDINNSGFVETANDSRPTPQGRYIQWNITLKSTADRKESPSLGLVRVAYSVNKRPTAAAGPAQDAFKRTRVTLAGAGTDPDGDGLTYRWAKLSGPMAALNATDISNPGFSPEFTGLYVFTLVVNDGYADSPVATATVRVPNRLPRSDAGPDQTGVKNTLVSFRGNGTDPDGDPLTYEWSQVDGPPLTLAGANKPILTFVPPKLGKYTFKLVVSDGEESSPPACLRQRNHLGPAPGGLAHRQPGNCLPQPDRQLLGGTLHGRGRVRHALQLRFRRRELHRLGSGLPGVPRLSAPGNFQRKPAGPRRRRLQLLVLAGGQGDGAQPIAGGEGDRVPGGGHELDALPLLGAVGRGLRPRWHDSVLPVGFRGRHLRHGQHGLPHIPRQRHARGPLPGHGQLGRLLRGLFQYHYTEPGAGDFGRRALHALIHNAGLGAGVQGYSPGPGQRHAVLQLDPQRRAAGLQREPAAPETGKEGGIPGRPHGLRRRAVRLPGMDAQRQAQAVQQRGSKRNAPGAAGGADTHRHRGRGGGRGGAPEPPKGTGSSVRAARVPACRRGRHGPGRSAGPGPGGGAGGRNSVRSSGGPGNGRTVEAGIFVAAGGHTVRRAG